MGKSNVKSMSKGPQWMKETPNSASNTVQVINFKKNTKLGPKTSRRRKELPTD